MPKGFVYILECSDGSYYTGSTTELDARITQHKNGQGANHTKKRLPVKLVYAEEFLRIDEAFIREKQIQGWSRDKKEALITGDYNKLPELSGCKNESYHINRIWSLSEVEMTSNVASTPLSHQYYSNGKLLITGEYLVLDSAVALAIPTKYGQSLHVKPIAESKIIWKSFDNHENIWFSCEFDLKMIPIDCSFDKLRMTARGDNIISERLLEIFKAAKKLNPDFLMSGFEVETHLNFPRNWGLGTSSTLINNIANWAEVDAYKLLELTFDGSGYDIACAQHNTAITYQFKDGEMLRQAQHDIKKRVITKVDFNPNFSKNLFFVYLNQKQDSRQGIAQYKSKKGNLQKAILEINHITKQMLTCKKLSDFESLINKHESIISNILEVPTVKELFFDDYKGSIKSLGAWGGDFVLVTGTFNDMDYFTKKGYQTVLSFDKMFLG